MSEIVLFGLSDDKKLPKEAQQNYCPECSYKDWKNYAKLFILNYLFKQKFQLYNFVGFLVNPEKIAYYLKLDKNAIIWKCVNRRMV